MDSDWSVYHDSIGKIYRNVRTGQVVRESSGVVLSRPHVDRETVPTRIDVLDVRLALTIAEAMLDG